MEGGNEEKRITYKVHLRRMKQLLFRILTRRRICRAKRESCQLETFLFWGAREPQEQRARGESWRVHVGLGW